MKLMQLLPKISIRFSPFPLPPDKLQTLTGTPPSIGHQVSNNYGGRSRHTRVAMDQHVAPLPSSIFDPLRGFFEEVTNGELQGILDRQYFMGLHGDG